MEEKKNLFRLASMMYLHLNNEDITNKKIINKIIESVMMDFHNKELTLIKIEEYIEAEHGIIITENELNESIKKYSSNYVINKFEKKINLKPERFQYLSKKYCENKVENIIDLFLCSFNVTIKNLKLTNNETKTIIYKFFHSLIGKSRNQVESIITNESVGDETKEEFLKSEIEIINYFLSWKNNEKSEWIYKLYNLGIEYSLLTVPGIRKNFPEILKGKKLYVDTNIIFRLIGINGLIRKKRMETFFKKCKVTDQEFLISKYTDQEFLATIDYYIKIISKNKSGKYLDRNLYRSLNNDEGIFTFYNEWLKSNKNVGIEKFKIDIQILYKKIIKEYDVKVDYSITFKEDSHDYIETAKEIDVELLRRSHKDKTNIGLTNDRNNIYLINYLRGEVNRNLIDTKYYIISADKGMINWNVIGKQPHSVYPSVWMSIMLKSCGRTEDDLRSFTDFLKLNVNESAFDDYEVFLISQGITSMISNPINQKEVINQMIENNFNEIIEGKNIEEKIKSIEEFTENYQEQIINEKEEKITKLILENEKNEELKESINKKNNEIAILTNKNNKNNELENNIIETNEELTKLRKRIDLGKIALGGITLLFILYNILISEKYIVTSTILWYGIFIESIFIKKLKKINTLNILVDKIDCINIESPTRGWVGRVIFLSYISIPIFKQISFIEMLNKLKLYLNNFNL